MLDALNSAVLQAGINLQINPKSYSLPGPIAVDVEHDEQGNLVGIGACIEKTCYYWTDTQCGGWLLTEDLIMHNGVSDMEMLRLWGINVRDEQLIWDTMLIGHLLDSSLKSYGLKDMSKRELGIGYPSYDDIVGKHKGKTTKTPKCPQLRSDCCGRITLDKQPVELVALNAWMPTGHIGFMRSNERF